MWMPTTTPEEEAIRKVLITGPIAQQEPESIRSRLSAMSRWRKWLSSRPQWAAQQWHSPTTLCFGSFLHEARAGGPTVASGLVAQLQWWRLRLGLKFPTQEPVIIGTRTTAQAHTQQQARPLEPWEFFNIVAFSLKNEGSSDNYSGLAGNALKNEGSSNHSSGLAGDALNTSSKLIAMTVIACLRYRHLGRAAYWARDQSLLSSRVSKGKRTSQGNRPGFNISMSSALSNHQEYFDEVFDLHRTLRREQPGHSAGLFPDVKLGKSIGQSATWVSKPISRAKIVQLLQLMCWRRPQRITPGVRIIR